MGLSQIRNDFVLLPSGRSLREANVRHFEIGPLHNLDGGQIGDMRAPGGQDGDERGHLFAIRKCGSWISQR